MEVVREELPTVMTVVEDLRAVNGGWREGRIDPRTAPLGSDTPPAECGTVASTALMAAIKHWDAIVVGSGPNGLAAAITLARAGRSVRVLESAPTLGGGMRSAELTNPGFVHDVCSAIHPLGVASPFFRSLSLPERGLEWIFSPVAVAHPFDDGTAALLKRSVEDTAATLGPDAEAYRKEIGPLLSGFPVLLEDLLAPLWPPPKHPILMARFGLRAMASARVRAEALFRGERARGLFAGLAAHAVLPLESAFTASFGYLFALLGHAYGWPLARGGSQRIADALSSCLGSLGGEIELGHRVSSLDDLPGATVVIFDLTPRQIVAIARDKLPPGYRRALGRYRYGPAAFKLDWALSGPIPWAASECRQAATVHLGGTFDEIAASEEAAAHGRHCDRPYVILAQQSLFDPSRAPSNQHTAWGYCHVPYCHVPNGSSEDMTARIEGQVERFAPGFRDLVIARSVRTPSGFETYNENYVGGDIAGGSTAFPQLFMRPVPRLVPYATPNPGLLIGSSSTPPGAGVHGMCGHLAARVALGRALA
jgi:phytoene dehydrogenase-like protein